MSIRADEQKPGLGATFTELVTVMRRLLGPDGCPWDQKQTLASLEPYLIEECYEVLDAIARGQVSDHCDELGDLLMQIVFHCEIRRAEGAFDVDDAIAAIVAKLIRRHPHVFAEASADTPAKVAAQWNEIKARERRDRGGEEHVERALAGVPVAMPALARAQQLTSRAASVGFDWPDATSCRSKLTEEVEELDQAIAAGDSEAIAAELGDVIFAAVNLARKLDCDAEAALRDTSSRFITRFEFIEDELARSGGSTRAASLAELDALWDLAKAKEPRN